MSNLNSLLWKGSLTRFKDNSFHEFNLLHDFFLYESCRSSIFSLASYLKSKGFESVHVCKFTCDAVIEALQHSGLNLKFYSLDIDFNINVEEIIQNINSPTSEFILWQCTLGSFGGSISTLNTLKKNGLFVAGDLALSFGSKINEQYFHNLFDASVISFECSKLISIGWGGGLKINDKQYFYYYESLDKVGYLDSFMRYMQELYCSFYNINYPLNSAKYSFFELIRKCFTAVKIFRRSSDSSNKNKIGKALGYFQKNILQCSDQIFEDKFTKSNYHYSLLYDYCNKLNIKTPKMNENFVYSSPRFPFFVEKAKLNNVKQIAKKNFVNVGFWFDSNIYYDELVFLDEELEYISLNIGIIDLNNIDLKNVYNFFYEISLF